jgi:hypothetical protein
MGRPSSSLASLFNRSLGEYIDSDVPNLPVCLK